MEWNAVVFRGRPGPVALNYTVRYYGHEVSCSRVAAGVGVPYTTVLALPYVHRASAGVGVCDMKEQHVSYHSAYREFFNDSTAIF